MLAVLLACGQVRAEGDWRAQLGSALKAPLDLSLDGGINPGADPRELETRIRSACVEPWLQVMSDAVDKGMNRCIAAAGATGSASYLLDGRRYSTFAYVQKLRWILAEMNEAARAVAAESPGAGLAPELPAPP